MYYKTGRRKVKEGTRGEKERERDTELENRYTRWKKLSDWCDTGSSRRNLKRCVFKMKEGRSKEGRQMKKKKETLR